MEIHLAGTRPTRRAPSEYFTGTVLQDPVIMATQPGAAELLPRLVRAGRPHSVAHPSAWADALRYLRRRPGAGQRRPHQGNPAR